MELQRCCLRHVSLSSLKDAGLHHWVPERAAYVIQKEFRAWKMRSYAMLDHLWQDVFYPAGYTSMESWHIGMRRGYFMLQRYVYVTETMKDFVDYLLRYEWRGRKLYMSVNGPLISVESIRAGSYSALMLRTAQALGATYI